MRLPNQSDEPVKIAELLASAHQGGHAWGDLAVLCRKQAQLDDVARVLRTRRPPHDVRKSGGAFNPLADTIKVITMHANEGPELLSWRWPGWGRSRGRSGRER